MVVANPSEPTKIPRSAVTKTKRACPVMSVLDRRFLCAVDYQDVYGAFLRLEFQSELLLDRHKDGRAGLVARRSGLTVSRTGVPVRCPIQRQIVETG